MSDQAKIDLLSLIDIAENRIVIVAPIIGLYLLHKLYKAKERGVEVHVMINKERFSAIRSFSYIVSFLLIILTAVAFKYFSFPDFKVLEWIIKIGLILLTLESLFLSATTTILKYYGDKYLNIYFIEKDVGNISYILIDDSAFRARFNLFELSDLIGEFLSWKNARLEKASISEVLDILEEATS